MKRRIAVIVLAVSGLLAAGSGPATATVDSTTAGGYWACVAVYQIDLGLCVENPLPERLPLP